MACEGESEQRKAINFIYLIISSLINYKKNAKYRRWEKREAHMTFFRHHPTSVSDMTLRHSTSSGDLLSDDTPCYLWPATSAWCSSGCRRWRHHRRCTERSEAPGTGSSTTGETCRWVTQSQTSRGNLTGVSPLLSYDELTVDVQD